MFKEITLRNFRTHRDTTITLHPITLLIGNNNSGKTNLLEGIQLLSRLVWRSHPNRHRSDLSRVTAQSDYFPHRYRLAREEEPVAWSVKWEGQGHKVFYELELHQKATSKNLVRCRERIRLCKGNADPATLSSGFDGETDRMGLRARIESCAGLTQETRQAARAFFRRLGGAFAYYLQPSYLKRGNESRSSIERYDPAESVRIPSKLGFEGGSFQKLIFYAKEREERVFSRFMALARRFDSDFHGVRLNRRDSPIWEFDLGNPRTDRPVEEFTSDLLSDGFLKAAAIALIVSTDSPPSIIMLEEIENGINPGNIREILHWLWQAALTRPEDEKSQFILTSHSPSILREFSDDLDSVFSLRLDRKTYGSDVRNLGTTLEAMVGIGAIDGTLAEDDQGRKKVHVPGYRLAELWHSGAIG